MKALQEFVRDEDVRRVGGFVIGSALFAWIAVSIYANIDHGEYAGMFLFFAMTGIAVIFGLIAVFDIVVGGARLLVDRLRRS